MKAWSIAMETRLHFIVFRGERARAGESLMKNCAYCINVR
jgi:hypothetical protein